MNRFNQKINLEELTQVSDKSFRQNLPPALRGKNTVFTAYGRNALFMGMKGIAVKTRKRVVLVPAYSCGDEIRTVMNAGFRTKVYTVKSSDLQVDINDLTEKITKDTAAVLLTHYFGFPQKEITNIRKICTEKGTFLIEDCAHALKTKFYNKYLGEFGDISIFSLRKFYPVPHGGALVVNNKDLRVGTPISMPSDALYYDLSMFFGYRSGRLTPGTPVGGNDIFGPRLNQYGGYKLGLSDYARWVIAKSDKKEIEERSKNYAYYFNFYNKTGGNIHPLLDIKITKDVVPSFFPLSVSGSESVCNQMRKAGVILCQPFWSHVHKFVDWKKYPEIKSMKQNTIVLPVTHRLSKNELNQIKKYAN